MADATRKRQYDACVSAIRSDEPMPPAARLWLARAALFSDDKGRTKYGPTRLATDCRLPADAVEAGINWLTSRGLVVHDHDERGLECWRLAHHDYDREDVIGGYSADAGQKRDGLPPQYGRGVDDIVPPPTGNLNFDPPTWDEIKADVLHHQEGA